ncbi:hypothetical protein C8046_15185 [Serinibacter arcticus]|uniref:IPT/TIG domain-containing protein n=1 Tax=Serinibacter arcticus TaxID=1655435 RepID=A0A2U1ZXS9_9MICO|nr:IPT/TIG domain-containing protein [Serinibacter arcticus]PWD51789.1 hypothetical protein C8046_15185 [Serinibacter arcticus]
MESLSPTSGPVAGGTTVTVTGTDLVAGSVVTVDGIAVPAADVTVVSDTELTYVSPAHPAGAVDVTVTTPGGTSGPLTFTYLDFPTVTDLIPTSGPVAGGTGVTVTGTGFVPGAVVTIDGVAVAPIAVTVLSSTQLVFSTPPHAAGPVAVTVITPGGTSNPGTFTYLDIPTATSLDPTAGPVAGGTPVTVTGTNLAPGSVVSVDGVDVETEVGEDGTTVSFVTPEHAAGPVDVVVTTPGGVTAPLTFTYVDVPTAISLDPTAGPVAGGTEVTLTGTNLVPGSVVSVDGVDVPTVVGEDGTTVSFVTPEHEAGPVDVVVTTPGGVTEPLTFTYVDVPTATSLDPTAGPVAGGTPVTVTGTNFVPGSVVSIDGVDVETEVGEDGTTVSFVTPEHAAGPVEVVVTTPGGVTAPLTFTYVDVPTAISLDPTAGPIAGGTPVTVTGTNFVPGSVVSIDGVDVETTVGEDGTTVSFVTPEHDAGPVDVVVTTPGGVTAPLTFTYVDVPTAISLDPTAGPVAGNTEVTVTGTNFVPGSVVSIDGVDVETTVGEDGTTVSFVTPVHEAGPVDVVVTTPGGVTEPLTFTYVDVPTAISLDPTAGPVAGGTPVTVTGTNFVPGSVVSIDGESVETTVGEDGTTVSFVTPEHEAGPVDVVVTTPGGVTAPLTFTYVDVPTAISLDPTAGPVAGGTPVTVTGTNFVPGSVVSIDGVDVETEVGEDETTVSFVTPPHAAGPVEVVVTTPGGVTAPLTFTYVDVPTATSLVPDAGPVAGGNIVRINGSVLEAGTVQVGGETAVVVARAVDGTWIDFVAPAQEAGPQPVTVTTAGGVTAPLTYTYVDVPTAISLDPTAGPVAGGTEVTVTGTNFVPGSVVSIDGVPVETEVGEGGTTVSFVTPPHEAGPVDVVVTTPGGETEPLTFTYVDVPTAISLDPTAGPVAGGTEVTVTGTNFVPGSVVSIDGVPVETEVGEGGTTVSFVTPPHEAGPVDVVVTTPGGETEPLTFTYVDVPTATSLDPTAGPVAGGTPVTVTGTNFVPGSVVSIDGVGVETELGEDGTTVSFVTPPHEAGPVGVVVTTPGGVTSPLTFTYVNVPTAISLDPTAGPVAGGTPVTVTGTNLVPGSVVSIDGVDVPTVIGEDGTTASFVTPPHEAGPVDVVVTTPGGVTAPLTFTYVDVPTAISLDPTAGPVAGGTPVTVTGTNFVPGSVVSIDGVPVDTELGEGGTTVSFVTPAHAAGPVDVVVTTPGGVTAPLTFTYVDVPTAISLDPTAGPVAGGTPVTVTGTNFVPGSVVSIDGVSVETEVGEDGTTVSFVTPEHEVGPVDVVVTTPGGTTAPLTFTYVDVPTATSLDPTAGPVAGGTPVTVTGTNFVPGSVVSIDGVSVETEVGEDGTTVSFVTPPHEAGPVDVVVTTPGGVTTPLTFTYVDVPTTGSLAPEVGPVAGGTEVTVRGANFTADSVVTIDESEVTPTVVDGEGTSLTFLTPPHAAGPVPVSVTTPGGSTEPLTFTYVEGPVVPTAASLTPAFGPVVGGTEVTVAGSDFGEGSVVVIDGLEVEPTAVNEEGTSLTFLTPAHEAGHVPVTVTTASGTSAPLTYTYVNLEVVVDGPGVPGGTVPVTGECWPPGATVTVQLQTPAGVNVGAPVTVVTDEDCTFEVDLPIGGTTPAGGYQVVVTDELGNSTVVPVQVVNPALTIDRARQSRSAGESNTVRGSAWEPGVGVVLMTYSTPRSLGTVIPLADGTFAVTFDTRGYEIGTHTVQATQTRSNGQVVVRQVTFEITAATRSGGGLATTGAGVLPVAIGALVLISAGAGLMVRRRQQGGRV